MEFKSYNANDATNRTISLAQDNMPVLVTHQPLTKPPNTNPLKRSKTVYSITRPAEKIPAAPRKRKKIRRTHVYKTPEKLVIEAEAEVENDGDTTPDCGYSSAEHADAKMGVELIRMTILELDRSLTNYRKFEPSRYEIRKKRIKAIRKSLVHAMQSAEL